MKTIFNTQFFNLYVETGVDLTLATELKIIYNDPDKVEGEWTASLDPTDNTRMFYLSSALNKIGKWKIYAKATFPSGIIAGRLAAFLSIEEGER